MKSVYEMSGIERAAALLVALGSETASDVLKHLDDDSIEKLTVAISKIGSLSAVEREDLIGEFLIDLKKENRKIKAGEDTARELLSHAFGKDKAEEIIDKLEGMDLEQQFEFLVEADTDIVVNLLKNEMPQTIAVTIGYLPSSKAAAIIKNLPRETAKAVAIKMAKMKKSSPAAAASAAKILKKRYNDYLKTNQKLFNEDGFKSLIDILTHMSGSAEKKLLDELEGITPQITDEIKSRVFNFENIASLSNKDVRLLIDEINDDHLIALSLKGSGDEIRFKFIRNMSKNRATNILHEMEALGPVRLENVIESRSRIVAIMMNLDEKNIITARRGGEIYVE
jgi:flagellar motor switch protein FliG